MTSILEQSHHDIYDFISYKHGMKDAAKGKKVLITGAGSGIGKVSTSLPHPHQTQPPPLPPPFLNQSPLTALPKAAELTHRRQLQDIMR